MDSITLRQKTLSRKIVDLETAIRSWSASHSQSNPGAVMALRDMKKDLACLYSEFHKTMVEAALHRDKEDG